MTTESLPASWLHAPFGWIGRQVVAGIVYLGGVTLLGGSALRSLLLPGRTSPALLPALLWQIARILGMGLPLVGLLHVSLGSFLSMQSYFGGTFVDGAGAVVGVGLIRNLAPLMSGLTLSALLATRLIPELRSRPRLDEPADPSGAVRVADAGRLTAVRVLAAVVAGPIFGLWGSLVGTLIGWSVAGSLLGVTTHSFFHMFFDMLWLRDVVGLIVKGMGFGLCAGLFACFEGLREDRESDLDAVARAAFRSVCLAAIALMLLNSSWFVFVYRAGPAFGPTLLAAPAPGISMN